MATQFDKIYYSLLKEYSNLDHPNYYRPYPPSSPYHDNYNEGDVVRHQEQYIIQQFGREALDTADLYYDTIHDGSIVEFIAQVPAADATVVTKVDKETGEILGSETY